MSDNVAAVKLVAILAIVILLANLMGVGASSPFQALQDTFSAGPSLPVFEDPFALREFVAHSAIPRDNSTIFSAPPSSWLNGCSQADYYKCVDSEDGGASFIRLNGGGQQVSLAMTPGIDAPPDIRVARIGVEVQARTTGANESVYIALYNAPPGDTFDFLIPLPQEESTAGDFTTVSQFRVPTGDASWSNLVVDIAIMGAANADIDVSFFRILFYSAGDPDCTAPAGAWFPVVDEVACQVAQGVDWLITALQFTVNAIIFAFLWLGGWVLWIGTISASFLAGIVAMSLWFLDLEAPAVIQGIFGIMTVVVIGFFSLTIIQLVRG